jgi:hypothetical protein
LADLCCEYSIAGLTINDDTAGADTLLTSFENGHILGLDGAPLRKEIDPQGQSDGGIVHPAFFGPRIITFQGETLIQSVEFDDLTNYLSALNTLEAAVISALEGILNTPSALSWTPTGLSGRTISVTYGTEGGEIQFDGPPAPGQRTFRFTLVAADPTIS